MPRTAYQRAPVLVVLIAGACHAPANATPPTVESSATYGSLASIRPMAIARAVHTATALADGRVLIAGGFTNQGERSLGAEVFDPATEHFTTLPPPITLRHSHTATLLADGTVLIAGGYAEGSEVTSSVELFDPSTNTFRAIAPLNEARGGHVAVRLGDGKVLVAGGVGRHWTFLSSAELYDPVTQRFTATGPMTVSRESHAAVRLQNGNVLIVGGHRDRRDNIKLYTSAEIFEPRTGSFRTAGNMQTRRHKHDAVVLSDGRVLISGGSDERDNRGTYSSTEFFDPQSESFSPGPSMLHARYKHAGASVLLANGDVLLAGGAAKAEVFEVATNKFRAVASDVTLAGQFSAVAALSGGRVLITGGYGSSPVPHGGAAAWMFRP